MKTVNLNRWALALLAFAALVVLVTGVLWWSSTPRDASDYIARGMRRLQHKQYRAAVEDLSRALEVLPPDDTENQHACYLGLSSACLELHEFERAAGNASRAIEIKPEYADSYMLRAMANAWLGHHRESLEDWKARLRLVPNDRLALSQIPACLCDLENYDDALNYARRFAETYPSDAYALYACGYVEGHRRHYEAAIRYFTGALNSKPDYADAHFARGYCYYRLGQTQKADADRKSAVRLSPSLATKKYETFDSTIPAGTGPR